MLPWFASTTALELLAGALESAASLCEQYIAFFYQQCAFEAGQGPNPDGAPSPALHSRVAGPLGRCRCAAQPLSSACEGSPYSAAFNLGQVPKLSSHNQAAQQRQCRGLETLHPLSTTHLKLIHEAKLAEAIFLGYEPPRYNVAPQ